MVWRVGDDDRAKEEVTTMSERNSWKHLSSRVRDLLDGESEDAVVLIGELDLVEPGLLAFVADEGGGALLIGVEGDDEGDDMFVVGCPVDEAVRQGVLDAAARCEPPLAVEVFVENTARVPFLRVEIPAGPEGEDKLLSSLDGLSGRLDAMALMLEATLTEVAEVRQQVDEGRADAQAMHGKLDKLHKATSDGVSRIRGLARHLGADDKLVAWERRQLRTLLTTAIDLAGRRSRPSESDDVVRQVRKTWSRLSDWVSDELVDPLQKDAQEMLRGMGEESGEEDEE
jgi:hypothetical protein